MSTNQTLFAGDGEPCAGCGAPLAADQRYCLTCGHRRAAARLPFLDILQAETTTELRQLPQPVGVAGAVGGAAPPPDDTFVGRARANSGLIAGVGVLLLAMLIGVLIGSGMGNDDSSSAFANQKPVVITVGAGAAAPAAAAPAATTDTSATDTSTDDSSSSSGKAKDDASSEKDAASKSAEQAVKPKAVSKSTIKGLDKLSGKEYQKQVDKLGKNISVGGKAPPKDNKAPAGGGDFQDIG